MLLDSELAVLTLDFVDDGLPKLLTLEAVELIEEVVIDCDVLVVLSELSLLVDDRDELDAELLELIDWLEADEPSVVLELLRLDSLPDDRLEGVRLLEDELLSDCVLLDSEDELTPEDGVLLLLPRVLDSDVLLSDVAEVSLSHSVARMYGGNVWAPLKIRESPVLNFRIAGSRFSPPAASVSSSSHWMLSLSVTVRYSVSPASTRVVRRSRPAKPNVPMFDTFQILTVRESKMPVGAGPSQKVIVLAMLAPRNEKSPGRLQREVSNPPTTPGLGDLDLYVAQTAEILIVLAFICQEGILIRTRTAGLQTITPRGQTITVIV